MSPAPSSPSSTTPQAAQSPWWKRWWRRLPPSRQDRFATLAPLLSVLLFLSAIVVAITYLRFEELEREQEAVTRDVEYAQQRLRLRRGDAFMNYAPASFRNNSRSFRTTGPGWPPPMRCG